MKTLIVFVSFLLVAPLSVADWKYVNESNGTTFYVDLETIKRGPSSTGWFLWNFAQPFHAGMSASTYWEADCQSGRIRLLYTTVYSGKFRNGKVLENDGNLGEWMYVSPRANNESIYIVLCGKNP